MEPAPITAGPNDGQPEWSPDGRFLAFTSKRGEQGEGGDAARDADRRAGRGAHGGHDEGGLSPDRWSPDSKRFAFITRTRDTATRPRTRAGSPAQDRVVLHPSQWRGVRLRPAGPRLRACPPTAPAPPRNLTPGAHQHEGVSWLPDSSAVVTSARRHDGWDFDYAVDLYLVPLDGEVRAITTQTGIYADPASRPTAAALRSSASTMPRRSLRTWP